MKCLGLERMVQGAREVPNSVRAIGFPLHASSQMVSLADFSCSVS